MLEVIWGSILELEKSEMFVFGMVVVVILIEFDFEFGIMIYYL